MQKGFLSPFEPVNAGLLSQPIYLCGGEESFLEFSTNGFSTSLFPQMTKNMAVDRLHEVIDRTEGRLEIS